MSNEQMKAYVKYNELLQSIDFEIADYHINFHAPEIKEIKRLVSYEDGFLTIDTSYGEEYVDYIEFLEVSLIPDVFSRKIIPLLRELKFKNIELRKDRNMFDYKDCSLENLEDKAFMVVENIAFLFERYNKNSYVVAVNLEAPSDIVVLLRTSDDLKYSCDSMDRENKFFALYVVERNKQRLLKGISQWENK